MPNEQAAGNPKYNSDIYALGMIAIQALTVTHPAHLPSSPVSGEVMWEDKATVSPKLAAILKKMVRYNFRARYQSATEVLEALKPLIAALPSDFSNSSKVKDKRRTHSDSSGDTPLHNPPDSTHIWSEADTPQEVQDSTHIWSEADTSQEVQDSTRIWSEADTPQEVQDSTRIWSEADTSQDDAEDSTIPKKAQAEE
jgi:serine/threonine protein kinase